MTASQSRSNVVLPEVLRKTPRGFAFTQIIDILEHLAAQSAGAEFTPLGRGIDPDAEVVQIKSNFDFAFNAGPIASLLEDDAKASATTGAPQLTVNFFGLGGSEGPLPEPYIEMILAQLLRKDSSAADFLDIFQHRLLSFVYRVENEFRIASPFKHPLSSPLIPALRAVLGCDGGINLDDCPELESILLTNVGVIAQQRHSLSGLLTLLRNHFKVQVTCREFSGCWIPLPDELQTILGADGQNDLLWENAVLGDRAWDQNSAIQIHMGPLTWDQYASLLPSGMQHAALAAICEYYVGPHITCEIHLELDGMPEQQSSLYTLGAENSRLGYTTWTSPLPPQEQALLSDESLTTILLLGGPIGAKRQKETGTL